MSQPVIRVENLSKRYQLGTIGYGSLQHDLAGWWAKVRGKDDPNARIGEKSRLDLHGDFWALRNVGFEVNQGDRVGIIGRNGAGKSTLLKLLSRVTSPTEGSIKVKGRIASLLEVGTGFHPELTGRENVFLNGAILGMKRREIQSKFDEIVSFAGVEQFIDTPVKRYSSGMYVRLAFSVAAHLDSEILIVDEVLAVGDAEFQKKCLGKMEDVSRGQGRTVLFVSHSIPSILQLCNKGIYLQSGALLVGGDLKESVRRYKNPSDSPAQDDLVWNNHLEDNRFSRWVRLDKSMLADPEGRPAQSPLSSDKKYKLVLDLTVSDPQENATIIVTLSHQDQIIAVTDSQAFPDVQSRLMIPGPHRVSMELPQEILLNKDYQVEASLVIHERGWSLLPDQGQAHAFTYFSERRHPKNFELSHPLTGTPDPGMILSKTPWVVES